VTLATERTCKIVRVYIKRPVTRVIERGLSHDRAIRHCCDPETCSYTARSARAKAHTRQHGAWYDGWDWE